jgi:polysaccharide biosynthesis transport protein
MRPEKTLMTETSGPDPANLTDYLEVVRRRRWIVIAVPLLAALVAFQYSSSQPSVYQAQAKVLVNRSAGVAGGVTDVVDTATYDSIRYLNTLAIMARSEDVAARVAAADGVPRITAGAVLGAANVSPDAEADLLNISVSYGNPGDAVVLANAYAREFTRYKTQFDTAQINDALQALETRAAQLRRSGETESLAYQTLLQEQSKLAAAGKLVARSTTVLERAVSAAKIEPRPRRALMLGALLGLLFALGLAFLAEALDRRVRSEGEIEERLGLPLIGRISRPPASLRKKNGLVMLAEPMGVHAEAFRKLLGTIEFLRIQRGAASRTIMFTSAAPLEGKSTTIANLAIALARSGRRVALVDLDLRRPFLHTFFGIRAEPGFTDVVVGREALARAVRHVSLPSTGDLELLAEKNGQPSSPPTGPPDVELILHLLPCGTIPPAPGEFLANKRVSALLDDLREQFDVVLVDAPPITVVGDAMTISASVDAIIAVTSLGIRRPLVNELIRELQNCSAATLGLVLTGVSLSDQYRYGYRRSHSGSSLADSRPPRGQDRPSGGQLRKFPTADEPWYAPQDESRGTDDADTSRREDLTEADGRA